MRLQIEPLETQGRGRRGSSGFGRGAEFLLWSLWWAAGARSWLWAAVASTRLSQQMFHLGRARSENQLQKHAGVNTSGASDISSANPGNHHKKGSK